MGNAQTFVSNGNNEPYPSFEPINITGMTTLFNGRVIRGNSISMRNGVLMVDGKPYDLDSVEDEGGNDKKVRKLVITIQGNVEGNVSTTTGDVNVTGSTLRVNTVNGGIQVGGDIHEDASTVNGGIMCSGSIHGRASTVNGGIHAKKRHRENDTADGRGDDDKRAKKKRRRDDKQ